MTDEGQPPAPQPVPEPRPERQTSIILAPSKSIVGAGFLDQLRALSMREVLLVDWRGIVRIVRSRVFWVVALVAFTPMIALWLASAGIVTSDWITLGTFEFFIAAIWALLFFRLFAEEGQSAWMAVLCLAFTAIPGIWLLMLYLRIPPDVFSSMLASPNFLARLFAFCFGVGVREEITKALPLILLLLAHHAASRGGKKLAGVPIPGAFARAFSQPMDGIIFGMMSGLGFAATENVKYMLDQAGAPGVMAAANAFLRATGLMFSHAVWSGLFGYFLGLGAARPNQRWAFAIIGLLLASVVHGAYDTVVMSSLFWGMAIQLFAYVLLLTYVAKQKQLECASEMQVGLFR